jgi:trans-aconitate methyltransferase
MAEERTARSTFNQVAALYDEARPGYPAAVFDDLIALARLAPPAQLLEIGAGTGHATLPLAERGFRIHCIELGEAMAQRARTRLAAFPAVTVTIADFDRWSADSPDQAARYNLAFAATSYHWLSAATRIQRIAALLAPGGHIAIFRNHHVSSDETAAFETAVQCVYDEALGGNEAPQRRARRGLPRPEEIVPAESEEWSASGLFHTAQTRVYRWSQHLSAQDYTRQLATHSDHRLLPDLVRVQLLARLERLIDSSFSGVAVKHYVTLLQVAEKIR